MLCVTIVLFLGVAAGIIVFKEWNSGIWGIPTLIIALILAAVAVGLASKLKIFKPRDVTPTWIIGCIAGYVLLSFLLGAIFAEPVSVQSTAPSANPYEHTRSIGVYHAFFPSSGSTTESERTDTHTSSGRSGKGAGIVILIIIVLVLLFGSAVIPHFWIAATFMGIVLMAFFTWKDFKGRRIDNKNALNPIARP